jgi:RNA polymerase sigma factor (sigma-70 family)
MLAIVRQAMNVETSEVRFRRLYGAHYEALLTYASRRLPDATEAHDVVADAFLVLWRRLAEAPPDEEVLLWLYGVARRVLANRYRSHMRRERLAALLARLPVERIDPEVLAARRADTDLVIGSLLSLGEHDREILLLVAWERLSNQEIGAVLGCSENAVALRLHRARKRLTEVCRKENERGGHKQGSRAHLRRPRAERHDQ